MTKYFINLLKDKGTQVQETQRVPNKMNLKRFAQRHLVGKMAKVEVKDRIFNAAREKEIYHLRGSFHKTVR